MSLRQRFGKWVSGATLKETALDAETARGAFRTERKINLYDAGKLEDYWKAYHEYDNVRSYIDDLVESSTGVGYYTTIENPPPVRQSRAKTYIDEFGRVKNLDRLLPNITRLCLIFGYCPVETILGQYQITEIEKQILKIVNPLTLIEMGEKAIEQDPKTNIVTRIHQKVGSNTNTIDGKNLAWFNYCQLGNDPRGFSLIASSINILNDLNKAIDDIEKIMERYIGPIAIWKSKGPIDATRQAVMNRQPGEDFFFGNLRDEDLANPDYPKLIQIDPRIPFWEYVEYLDRRLYSSYRCNSVWYSRDATQSSAEVMDQIVMRHVGAIQRDIKRSVEQYWFEPLVELNNLSEVPRLNWGKETTGVEDIQVEAFLTKGLELGYLNNEEFREILRQLGLHVSTKKEAEEEEEEETEEKPEEKPIEKEKPETEKESIDAELKKTKIKVYKKLLEENQ